MITTLTGHTCYVNGLVILPNSSSIISCSWDRTIKITSVSCSWDYTFKIWQSESQYECIITLYGQTDWIEALTISGSYDKTIKIWQSQYPYNSTTALIGNTNWVLALTSYSNNVISWSHQKCTFKASKWFNSIN